MNVNNILRGPMIILFYVQCLSCHKVGVEFPTNSNALGSDLTPGSIGRYFKIYYDSKMA